MIGLDGGKERAEGGDVRDERTAIRYSFWIFAVL